MKPLALFVALALGGCSTLGITNWSPDKARIIGCESYASALVTLAGYRKAGKLSAGDAAAVDQWRAVLNPICLADTAPTTAFLLDTLEKGVFALISLEKKEAA